MSVRAYKILKQEIGENPTFNLSNELEWIVDLASQTYSNDSGEIRYIEFEKETIEAELKATIINVKETSDETKEEYLQAEKVLENILKEFDEGEEYITYECY